MPSNNNLPLPTRKRMIELLQLLNNFSGKRITSQKISESTGWKDTLIRHDFWLIKAEKGVSNGYDVEELKSSIITSLGLKKQASENHAKNVCIAGLGRLGAALLDENFFNPEQYIIKAGFDSNIYRVEILRSTFPLYPASEMEHVIRKENIELAILTVADKYAQSMSDKLIKNGITGIVNMTNTLIKVPEGVKVENISILNALNLIL